MSLHRQTTLHHVNNRHPHPPTPNPQPHREYWPQHRRHFCLRTTCASTTAHTQQLGANHTLTQRIIAFRVASWPPRWDMLGWQDNTIYWHDKVLNNTTYWAPDRPARVPIEHLGNTIEVIWSRGSRQCPPPPPKDQGQNSSSCRKAVPAPVAHPVLFTGHHQRLATARFLWQNQHTHVNR